MSLSLSDLLKRLMEMSGSDLHITTNSPPQIRVHGHLVPLDLPQMTPADTKQLAYSVMTDAQKHRFEESLELDFSFGLKGLARFRANVFNQRELHADTKSFTDALRAALREDPDVVLIGEMRDLETIESALRIAETGHLTFGTLHTNSASSTINRIIDVFPAHQQPQIRAQLSLVLEGIMCQSLLPKSDGKGRAMCMEIMVPNAAIRNLIREDKIHQIYSAMQTGQDKFGMQTFNQALSTAYLEKQITIEMALSRSSNQDELNEMISRGASLNRSQPGAMAKSAAPGRR